MLQLFQKARQARRHVFTKTLQVADYRRKSQKTKGSQCSGRNQQQYQDCAAPERPNAPDAKTGRRAHHGREHHCEQCAHIKKHEHVAHKPCQVTSESQGKCKCHVSSKITASAVELAHPENSSCPVGIPPGCVIDLRMMHIRCLGGCSTY